MKVTAIIGSPRKTGNTATLTKAIINGAQEENAETSIHYLGEKTINGCTGCYSCRETLQCAIDDDMSNIYNDIDDSDALVFASPIYIYNVTGQFKTFLDRMLPYYWGRSLKVNKSVLALTWGFSNPELGNDVVDWFKRVSDGAHFELVEVIKVPNTGSSSVEGNMELLCQARKIGKTLTQK